ncbi:MAG: rod shape-determining protein MreC [Bacteroidetes bacterium]|nr:rod shape-determining protein MreC [Bacteroidota bacterium]MBU1680889.1 rod shape-determining protein MreC [Bacteroidota bacterium]MBU2507687.1 rod shape-determining protein MreC [Bacteroidota bacterium]
MKRFLRNFFKNYREYIVLVLLLVISLTILPLNNHPKIKELRSYSFGAFAVINSSFHSFTNLFKDNEDVERLQKLNAELMLQINLLRKYGLENSELRRLLEHKDSTGVDLITAEIISKLASTTQGNFIVNKGNSDSIKTGMPVINENGLIGIVSETSSDFSVVKNIKNSNLKMACSIQRTNINGLVNWDGNKLVMKNTATTLDIQIGDRVVTSDFSTIFPPSIPVGLVSKIESNIYGVLTNIVIEPFVDLKSIENVFIIKIVPDKKLGESKLNLMGLN